MKIAVTYENGNIFRHFGNCENFKFYNIEDNKVISTDIINIEPKGQKAVAEFLASQGVTHLICGGLGSEARASLEESKIAYYPKVKALPDEAVELFIAGNLEFDLVQGCCGGGKKDHSCSSGGCHKK